MGTPVEMFAMALRHHGAGDLSEAERICREIVTVAPEDADAWHLIGAIQLQRGKFADAIEHIEKAVAVAPDAPQLQNSLGVALQSSGLIERSEACFRRAIELRPDYAEAFYNLGNVLRDLRQPKAAAECYRAAIELKPGYAQPHNNLGLLLAEAGATVEAFNFYRSAVAIDPACAEANSNLGLEAHYLGDFALAEESYGRAIELRPDYPWARWNRSRLFLLLGRFEVGWREYESRWKTGQFPNRNLAIPRWNGEEAQGKTVLVWAEQGLGDTIQFVRYLKLVKERGARVVFECQRALVKLLSDEWTRRNLEIDELVAEGDVLPDFDFKVPLLSLPGVFGTKLETIPAFVPYMHADQALVKQWREKLATIDGFRIGINWHGRAGKRESKQRDVPLEMFERLARVPGVRLVSLQKEEVGSKDEGRQEAAIMNLGKIDAAHGAFMDTAAMMMNLDLVITSDTSVAHLAGALGTPVWVALPFVPDWRWLLDRSDSPWYPTMRLFRQKSLGDWKGVFDEIQVELMTLPRCCGSEF